MACSHLEVRDISKVHFKTVIIVFASELIVVLWHGLSCSSAALSKHLWEIILLSIDLHLTARFSKVTFECVWVDDLLDLLSLVIDKVVCCDEVSLLKDVLSLSVSKHNVALDSSLWMCVGSNIVSIFSF